MNEPTLVPTDAAAAALGMTPSVFRSWAHYRGVHAVRHVRVGRSKVAVWDLAQVYAADREHPRQADTDTEPGTTRHLPVR